MFKVSVQLLTVLIQHFKIEIFRIKKRKDYHVHYIILVSIPVMVGRMVQRKVLIILDRVVDNKPLSMDILQASKN